MTIRDFAIASASRSLGRPVALDPDVPLGGRTPVQWMLSLAAELMHQRSVFGCAARVRPICKLRIAGGLIRIDASSAVSWPAATGRWTKGLNRLDL